MGEGGIGREGADGIERGREGGGLGEGCEGGRRPADLRDATQLLSGKINTSADIL